MPNSQAPQGARSPLRAIPDGVWTPLAAGLLMLLVGLVGLAAGRPLLFPSLGPTAIIQAQTPDDSTARPYNVVVSHLAALASAFLAVTLFGIAMEKAVFQVGYLSAERVGASVLAVALTAALQAVLRAPHPAAAATTLLAALGAFHPTARDTVTVVAGVLVVAVAGEALRRLRAAGGRVHGAT